MATSLNEPIKVGAIFWKGAIKPAWFIRQGRTHTVKEVTFRWETHDGAASIIHLAVTDGTNLFELTLNQQTMLWRLAAVEELPTGYVPWPARG